MGILSLLVGKIKARKKLQKWTSDWRNKNKHNFTTLAPMVFPEDYNIHPELFMHIGNCICKWLCMIKQLQS